jgi:hypothetical protein
VARHSPSHRRVLTRGCRTRRRAPAAQPPSLASLLHEDYQPNHLPADGLALAFLAAIVLQVSTGEKQRLLEVATLGDLLRDEVALLRREIGLVEFMARGEPAATTAFSRN